jgi:hypothetical protein
MLSRFLANLKALSLFHAVILSEAKDLTYDDRARTQNCVF